MTTTLRRSAKISTSGYGYVAIKCDHIHAATNSIRCVAKKDMHIKGTNGAEVHLRLGDVFYLVRAASLEENMFYIVLADARGAKKCSCPQRKPCKHERVVSDLVAARPSEQRAISSLPLLLPALTPRQQERIDLLIDVYPDGPSSDVIPVIPRQAASIEGRGSLNGSRAFSILR